VGYIPKTHSGRKSNLANLLIGVVFAVALIIYVIIEANHNGYISSPYFWIALTTEICLAFSVVVIQLRSKLLFGIVFILSFLTPLLLANNIIILKPIVLSPFVFIAILAVIFGIVNYVPKLRQKFAVLKLPSNFPFNAIFPSYLPFGLEKRGLRIYKKSLTLEVYYVNDEGAWLFVYEAEGAIVSPEYKIQTLKSEKIIAGITIGIAQEIPKTDGFRKPAKLQPPYFEAIWSKNGINFKVRTDWIPLEDVEKILISMIKQTV
jgi:hypothetical protein